MDHAESKPVRTDLHLLSTIAQLRVVSINLLMHLHAKARRTIDRAVLRLQETGLVQAMSGGPHLQKMHDGQCRSPRGRPQRLVALSARGVDVLHDAGALDDDVTYDHVDAAGLSSVDHQMLENWCQVSLRCLEHALPPLSIRYLSAGCPMIARTKENRPIIFDTVQPNGPDGDRIGFIPDAVFTLTHAENNRTLLCFLEADTGTETIASDRPGCADIRGKIVNYQWYFHDKGYKRYEAVFGAGLNGFRLLFVTLTESRLAALCHLVRNMNPCDFIWLTNLQRIMEHGVGADVWARGGRDDVRRESILGGSLSRGQTTLHGVPSPGCMTAHAGC